MVKNKVISRFLALPVIILLFSFAPVSNVSAIVDISLDISNQTNDSLTLSGIFEITPWIPYCGANGSTTYGLWPRNIDSFSYNIHNPENGQVVKTGRAFTPDDYTQTSFGDVLIDCPTNFGTDPNKGQDPWAYGIAVDRFNFNNISIDISGLAPGNYSIDFYSEESPDGSCDVEYWDIWEEEGVYLNNCGEFLQTYTIDPGIGFTIGGGGTPTPTPTPTSATINVNSNINSTWTIDGPGGNDFTGSGTSSSDTGPAGDYVITPAQQTCYDLTMTPSNATQGVLAGGTITWSLRYDAHQRGGCAPVSPPGNFSAWSSCFGWPSPMIETNLNPSSGADSYTLERSADGGGWEVRQSGLSYQQLDNYSDSSISPNSNYNYRVRAVNSGGSTLSSETGGIVVNSANCGGVNPVCAATHYNCSVGTARNGSDNPTTWTWLCGASGGDASCTEQKPPPVCSTNKYLCDVGTPINGSETSTTWTWLCRNSVGDASCSIPKTECSGSAPTQSCSTAANACGQTSTGTQSQTCNTNNYTWTGGWTACSVTTPPPTPTPVACSGSTSSPNACGQTSPGGAGTIQCYGTASQTACNGVNATPPPTPTPTTCTSSANACGQTADATATCGNSCVVTPPPNTCVSTISLSASPNPVIYGMASTLTWNSTNMVADSCSFTTGASSIVGTTTGLPVSGTGTSRPTTKLTSDTPYTITCTGFDGAPKKASVTVNVGPAPVMNSFQCNGVNTNGTCTIPYNGTAGITWSSSNTTICSLVSTVPTDDPVAGSGSRNDTGIIANRNYSIECWNGTSGVHAPALPMPLRVVVSGPTVDIDANSSDGPINVAYGSNPIISWSSNNAGSCTVSPTGWTGTSGSQPTGAIIIPGSYTYTATCLGNGSSTDSVTVNVSNPVPTAYSATYSGPDYCQVGPGGYIAWSYSDPSGSPQVSYQIQIDDQGSFQNNEYDSGQLNSSSKVFTIPNGVLQFNKGYKARVRVWNTYGSVSSWTETSTFNTPNYAYPDVEPPYQFTWPAEPRPQQNKAVQFTDRTAFGGGNVNNRSWSWNFGDGTTSTQQSPAHTFTTIGTFTITQTATDAANQSCSYSQSINIQKPIPVIKEVAPK